MLSAAQLDPPALPSDATAALSLTFFFFFFLTSPFAARATTEASGPASGRISRVPKSARGRSGLIATSFFRGGGYIGEDRLTRSHCTPLPVDVSLTRPARFSSAAHSRVCSPGGSSPRARASPSKVRRGTPFHALSDL